MAYKQILDVAPPDDYQTVRLANFTAAIGSQLCKSETVTFAPAPHVKWFDRTAHPSVEDTLGMTPKSAPKGNPWVWIASDLKGHELIQVILHETRHTFQPPWMPREQSDAVGETDARLFESWAPVVAKAYRVSRGFASEVLVADELPPIERMKHLGVVIVRPTRIVHQYNARAMGPAWTEIT